MDWRRLPKMKKTYPLWDEKGQRLIKAGIGSAVLSIKGGTYYGFQTDCPRLVPVAWLGFSIR